MQLKVQAQVLQRGDVCRGSGETVVKVAAGLYTPTGKIEVTLIKGDRMRTATWNKSTLINIDRGD